MEMLARLDLDRMYLLTHIRLIRLVHSFVRHNTITFDDMMYSLVNPTRESRSTRVESLPLYVLPTSI